VPPYLPDDYVSVRVEGDRVFLEFAEQFRRPVHLNFEEAVSLMLALRSLPARVAAKAETLAALEEKIADILPTGTRDEVAKAESRIQVSALPKGLAAKIRELEGALRDKAEIEMEYFTASRDEMTLRRVRPYGIVNHMGEWYVVGHCLLRDRELPFRVDRIKSLRRLEAKFDVPPGFNIAKYRRAEMYIPSPRDEEVKIRFSPEIARWLRERMPPKLVSEQADGSLILTLRVSRPDWMVGWLLQYAEHADVLSPPSLRKRMQEACREVAGLYGAG